MSNTGALMWDNAEAVERLVRDITDAFGGLHGVIHSAGVTRDNFILKKDPQELAEVLAPKVAGCVNLDRACQDLDFFVLFSSLTACGGQPGPGRLCGRQCLHGCLRPLPEHPCP